MTDQQPVQPDPPTPSAGTTLRAVVGGAVAGFFTVGAIMLVPAIIVIPVVPKSLNPSIAPLAWICFPWAAAALLLSFRYGLSRRKQKRMFYIGVLLGMCLAALLEGFCFSQMQ